MSGAITGIPEVDEMTPSQAFHAGRRSAAAEIERLQKQCAIYQGIADQTWEKQAEIERLRAALTAFVSAWQTSTRPPDGVEFEAVELCGGMAAIRGYEQ